MAVLRRNGFEVLGAEDGTEGLAMALAQSPSLVLCDVNMDGRSGFEVLKELRARPATSAVPVIFMTGKPEQADARFSMNRGADDYLPKPFAMEQMLAAVQARLQRQQGINLASEQERAPMLEQLQLLTSALESAANAVAITDIKGKIEWINRAFTKLTGYTSAEAVGQNPRLLKSGRQPPKFYTNLWTTVSTGNVWHGELVNKRKDGSLYFEEMTVTPVRGANGEIQNFIAIKLDVSARKESEKILRQSEARFHSLFENIPEGFACCEMVFDGDRPLDFIYVEVNSAFEKLTGLKNVRGKKVSEVVPGIHQTNPELLETYGRVARTGTPERFETYLSPLEIWFSINVYSQQPGHFVAIFDNITKRKQTEQALARERDLLQALMDNLPDNIYFKDAQSRFVRINQATARHFGLRRPEEAVGKTDADFFPMHEARQKLVEEQCVLSTGKPILDLIEKSDAADRLKWVCSTKVPICSGDGKVTGLVGISRDITKSKLAEVELLESRRFLQSALDALSAHIAILDEQGTIMEVNAAWDHFASENGFHGSQAGVGDNYLKICDAAAGASSEGAAAAGDGIRAVMAGERAEFHLEYACHSPQEERWFVVRATRFGGDGPVRVVVAHENITKRKRMEDELQRKSAFLEAQVNSSIDGILVVDEQGRKTLQNRRLTELCKIPQSIAANENDEAQLRWVTRMIKNPETFVAKIQHLKAHRDEISQDEVELTDGTILDRYSAPLTGRTGKYYGRMWTFHDITERRRKELERQRMEVHLRQSQKLESIGQLAAGIAHEINTPTQYVGDNTRFVKDAFPAIIQVLKAHEELVAAAKNQAVTPALLARCETLLATSDLDYLYIQIPTALAETLEGVERVSKIVRAMKEFSHPGGKEKSPADLNKAIESTVTVARNEWKYVADLKLELEKDLPLVPCFVGEFNQCILNLIVNAAHAIGDVVKKNPGTKGLITVRTRHDSDHVEVRVTDTGTGIPEAARPKIFEPFFTTKDVGKGTGQGLAMIYGCIVKRHGGAVSFETETGRGSTFILRLPLKSSAVPNAEPTPPLEISTA